MTICIANEKGGSGKSTLCLNLAVQLLKDNKEVVVLDTDSQKSMETLRKSVQITNIKLLAYLIVVVALAIP